ncbi:MAG TPA: HAMP domain-containing protein, partial [Bryobacteraceae bacterium]|nr:HAMP domain-containing protein [Bryobacteraceae bacterium]
MAGALIPLSGELNAIERTSLEQALMLERAVRHLNTDDAEQARSEVDRFRELNAEVDSHLKKALQYMKAGLAHTAVIDDAIHLARLDPELDTLRREHARYAELGLSLVDNAKRTPQQLHDLKAQLSTQEDRLDEAIDRLAERLETASGRESALVSERQARAYLVSAESLGLAVTAFLLGSILSALVTRRLVRPVRALISGAQEVTRGNLDVVVDVSTSDEVGTLALAFQNMIVELRAKARIKETFGKYLDPRVVERLIGDGQTALGGGEKKVMTVFFSDLQGFSSISESLTAAGLVNLINNYLT